MKGGDGMTFGFDDRYAMFDVTPVENQFILEHLPGAKGDFVKVYLYGLMYCYHPEQDMSLERMSRELGMTEEEVLAAYRYWERHRAVRRISDNPPQWRYISQMQKNLAGEDDPDPGFAQFQRDLYDVFGNGRQLHGNELVSIYEWKEDLGLPTEVIIMLLKHMAAVKGKNFSIKTAGNTAVKMAEENVRTLEAAEDFLSRDRSVYDGTKKVLRRLGRYNPPSEGQVEMYRKWVQDWHFTPEEIEKACDQTAKGEPSMGYVDGILNNIRNEDAGSAGSGQNRVKASAKRREGLRDLLRVLGKGDINPQNLRLYDEITGMYNREVILTAAAECARTGGGPEEVKELLTAWKQKGLDTPEAVKQYVAAFHEKSATLKTLREKWGGEAPKNNEANRKSLDRWEKDMGMSREMILLAAGAAENAKNPMQYLNKVLSEWAEKGIRTPEEAKREMEARKQQAGAPESRIGKHVAAQDYQQRDYTDMQRQAMERFIRQNGGEPDA